MLTEQDFYQQIQAETRRKAHGEVDGQEAEGRSANFKENAFTEVVLEHLAELGIGDGASLCHYAARTKSGELKLNGYCVDEEEGIATLVVTKYYGTTQPVRMSVGDIRQSFNQAVRAYEEAGEALHSKMEPSQDAHSMMDRLHATQGDVSGVEIVLITDGLLPPSTEIPRERRGAKSFRYYCWDVGRLYRSVVSSLPYESTVIDLESRFGGCVPCLHSKSPATDHEVYLAVLPGGLLCELYDEYGPQLLDLNVRSFLQARGKVNQGIRTTLCTEPTRFLAYNNGISATAESLDTVSNGAGAMAIRKIKGFQVVNGGQTMASIHRAAKIDKADISDVLVQAKITVMAPEKIGSLAPLISRYANSQNKVNDADFSSNDPFNLELQRQSENVWAPGEQSRWFYERTRGQYQVTRFREGSSEAKLKKFDRRCPPSQRFSKTDMAKYETSWQRLPHIVSLGAQKNFVWFMDRLREKQPKDWKPGETYFKELVAKALIFRAAEKAARETDIEAYRANVVTYSVALLSEKSLGRLDLEEIWNRQVVPKIVHDAMNEWTPQVYKTIVKSAGKRNVTEWCKKEGCWQALLAVPFKIPQRLLQELEQHQPPPNVGKEHRNGNDKLTTVDRANIAKTMQIDSETWFRISGWGRTKKTLEEWQCGIAITLAGYAQGNWDKVPSAKQAKQAIRILKTAEEDGFFSSKDREQ